MNRTLSEHSSFGLAKKVRLYLVEPTEKLSYQFASLRNQLESCKVPYTSLIGFDDVKQLMNDQSHKNVIIVNNSNLNQNELPKEVFDYNGNEIYFYPYPFQNYRYVEKPQAVINLYRNYTDDSGNQNHIRLRSIKKDLQRSKEPRTSPELYKNIMIMNQRGVNPLYKKLFQVLQNYRPRVTTINRENDIMNCELSGKSLIIVQRESYDTTNKFVNNNRLQKNIELAILGYAKGLNKGKNFAIITDNPAEIIDFLEESGTNLNLAKQMLSRQSGLQNNFVASADGHNQNQNTGMFVLDQGRQLSFAAQEDNRIGQPTFGQRADDGGQTVTYTDQNHIPINSRLSESSKNTVTKKSIKKIKGEKNEGNISETSVVASSVDRAPVINIKGINSISSNQQLESENVINQNNFAPSKKKPIMNWSLSPSHQQKNSSGKVPTFVLKPHNQAPAVNNGATQNKTNPVEMEQANHIVNSNKIKKPVLHWYIFPDQGNTNSRPSFIQMSQQQFNTRPLAIPSIPSIISPANKQNVTSIQKQQSQPIIESSKSINESYSLNRSPPGIVINRVEQTRQPRVESNDKPVRPIVVENLIYTSKKSIESESGQRSLSTDSMKYDQAQKLEEKYATSHRITEMSQENRASTISFPNQQQTSKRYVIGNNSYTAFGQPANNLQIKRSSSGAEKETKYWSEKMEPEIKRAQIENRSSTPATSNFSAAVSTSSYDRPPRIVRNEPQTVENHYQKQTSREIESSKQIVQVTPYRSPQLISPARAEVKAGNPVITNPAYAPINALVNNLGKTATPQSQRGLISNPAYTVMGRSTDEAIRRDSVRLPQQVRPTSNVISNRAYTSSYVDYSSPVSKPSTVTVPVEPKKDMINSYPASVGIDTSKYDIVTDEQGRTVYKLKQSFFSNPTSPKQNALVERYRSTPKTVSVYEESKPVNSPRTSINSPRALENNTSHTYTRIEDKHTTNSYSSSALGENINNGAAKTSFQYSIPQENKQVIATSTTTTTTNNYGINRGLAETPTFSTTKAVFNWDDYEEHTDSAGRKYYKVKTKSASPAPSYTQTITPSPATGNASVMPITTAQNIGVRVTSNENILSPKTVSTPYKTDTNHFGSPRSSAHSQQLLLDSKNQSYTAASQNLLIESRFGEKDSKNNNNFSNGLNEPTYRYAVDKQVARNPVDGRQINQGKFYQDGITRTLVSPTAAVQQTVMREQTPYGHRETYAFEKVQRTMKSQEQDYKRSNATEQISYNTRNHQFNNPDETSGLSRDSQFTDKTSSLYKAMQPHLYNDQRIQANNFRAADEDQLHRLREEYKSLKTKNNYTHYIIDTSHPLWLEIEKLPNAQDKVAEINAIDKIYDFMLDKPLPNDYYDIGFIFLNGDDFDKVLPSSLVDGYYLVDVDPSNPPLDIKKDRKQIKISDLTNLSLAKKVLLSPNIQHYVFHPRNSDPETSKLFNMFPSTKFQKLSYTNRSDLESQLGSCMKNKGRLSRFLIITNLYNISEIAPVLQSAYNQKNFTMICSSKDHVDERVRSQYKKVLFPNEFDFHSYGSVMAAASFGDPSDINVGQSYETDFANTGQQYKELSRAFNVETSNKSGLPKIFIQHPHKEIDRQIERAYPGRYQCSYFTRASEIKDRSHDNWVLLHREADNVGQQFDRGMGTVIVLGGRNGERIPSGSIKLGTVDELIEILQS